MFEKMWVKIAQKIELLSNYRANRVAFLPYECVIGNVIKKAQQGAGPENRSYFIICSNTLKILLSIINKFTSTISVI